MLPLAPLSLPRIALLLLGYKPFVALVLASQPNPALQRGRA